MSVTTTPAHSRRQALCGLAAALVAPAALAACTDSGSTPTQTSPPPSPGGPSGALAKLSDVPAEGGLLVESPKGKVLLVRVDVDTIRGLDPTCPHMGAIVEPPRNGVITCPLHGSTFEATTGALRGGPATSGLTEVPVAVSDGNVILA